MPQSRRPHQSGNIETQSLTNPQKKKPKEKVKSNRASFSESEVYAVDLSSEMILERAEQTMTEKIRLNDH